MPAHGPLLLALTAGAIALLLILILAVRLHAFVALLLASMALGLAAGMSPDKLLKSMQAGFGDALGFIGVVVGLGAMIGGYLEYSGGCRALADWLLLRFGKDRAAWAMLTAAFLVGLPIFFEVGFIILVPLVWNLARETRRSLLLYGLPMAAALTVTHSLVPPHPAPASAAQLLGADLGRTILQGVAVSVPMVIAGGVVYGAWISRRMFIPVPEFSSAAEERPADEAPPVPLVVLLLLLPVLLIFGATLAGRFRLPPPAAAIFFGHPFTALAVTLLLCLAWLTFRGKVTREQAAKLAAHSLAPMGGLLCIIGGGGAFKQVIVDIGVGTYAGNLLMTSAISPLLVVYVIAAAMRMAQGSATVAIITAAGIVAPIVKGIPGYTPEILVLALCCGGSAFSHVNDSGFWIVNQYFGMKPVETLKSWTAMKIVSSLVGLAVVMSAHALFR